MHRKRNSEKLEPQHQPVEPEMQKQPDEPEHSRDPASEPPKEKRRDDL